MDYVKYLEREELDADTLYEYKKVVLGRVQRKAQANEQSGRRVVVLDAGCGTGRLIELIGGFKNTDVFGIDIERDNVNFCRKKGLKVKHASITKIPFKDNTFDFVVCWNLLEHLERDEILKASEETIRVVKGGGKIIIHSPSFSKTFWDMPDHTYPVSEVKIKKLFNTAEDIEFVNYHIPKIRGLIIGKLGLIKLYDNILKLIPLRGSGMTTAIITKPK